MAIASILALVLIILRTYIRLLQSRLRVTTKCISATVINMITARSEFLLLLLRLLQRRRRCFFQEHVGAKSYLLPAWGRDLRIIGLAKLSREASILG